MSEGFGSRLPLALFFLLLYFGWHCWFLRHRKLSPDSWKLCVRAHVFVFEPFMLGHSPRPHPPRPLDLFIAVLARAVGGLQTRWSHIFTRSFSCKHNRSRLLLSGSSLRYWTFVACSPKSRMKPKKYELRWDDTPFTVPGLRDSNAFSLNLTLKKEISRCSPKKVAFSLPATFSDARIAVNRVPSPPATPGRSSHGSLMSKVGTENWLAQPHSS